MVAIREITRQLFYQYDTNRNGSVSLKQGQDFEAERLEQTLQPGLHYDQITLSWVSMQRLFAQADTDRNQEVTPAEVEQLLNQLDQNKNGYFEYQWSPSGMQGELSQLFQRYPEERGLIRQYGVPRQNFVAFGRPAYAVQGHTVGRGY